MELPRGGGVVPMDKPHGPTSHDIVAAARRALGTRRIGHTGTLDPLATGLLLLCVGQATRLVEFLTVLPKSYRARARLGVRTATDDSEGQVETVSEAWRALTREHAERALAAFRGSILQIPPRFSAKKVGGEAAHYRARRGEPVALAPTAVEVRRLELVGWEPPEMELDVLCSSGTYVRALARDLGEALGTGAHLVRLRRTAVGPFTVATALAVADLANRDAVRQAWLTPAAALAHLPCVVVGAEEAERLARGQAVTAPRTADALESGPLAVLRDRELIAVAERRGDRLSPRKVFAGQSS